METSNYLYSASLYLRNDIVAMDGMLSGRDLVAVLRHIFPDEMFDQISVRNVINMAEGRTARSFDILVIDGKVQTRVSDDMSDFHIYDVKLHPDNWGPFNTNLTEFKVFVPKNS